MTMMTNRIEIVEARPEHTSFIAWVMMAAARSHMKRGIWEIIAGDDEARTLRMLQAVTSTPEVHFGHHSLFLVSEVDGQPAAGLMGYFDEEYGTSTIGPHLPAGFAAAGITEAELAERMPQALTMMNLGQAHEPGAWIVEHVATHPDFRRQGHVDRLLQAILQRGRERGAAVADIGVFIGNDRAQKAYEKAGFRVVDEKRDAAFEAVYGCPGMYALTRPL